MVTVRLPWPPKELSPNARVHRHAKARATKSYRTSAFWLAEMAGMQAPPTGEIAVTVEFCAPDHRPRDLDNMLSSIKAGLDGIADCIQANDYRYTLTLKRGAPCKGGAVVVTLEAGERRCEAVSIGELAAGIVDRIGENIAGKAAA